MSESNKPQGLQVQFETQVTEQDLMNFKLYHNYHSVGGVAGLLFGIVALIICVVSVGQVNISYTLMMGFFGLFFTVYTPIGMKLKVKQQMKTVAAFKEPVRYTVTEEKILLQQGQWPKKCSGKTFLRLNAQERVLFYILPVSVPISFRCVTSVMNWMRFLQLREKIEAVSDKSGRQIWS